MSYSPPYFIRLRFSSACRLLGLQLSLYLHIYIQFTVLCVYGMYILRPQVGISPQTENVFTSPAEQETQKLNFWDLVELFIDPGGFANQKEVNRPYALLVVLAGMLLLTGILISVFSNMLERRVERFRKGDSHYAFSNHIIILGIDDMVPYLIQQLRRNAEYKKCDIVVLTVEDTEQVRLKFHAELNRNRLI